MKIKKGINIIGIKEQGQYWVPADDIIPLYEYWLQSMQSSNYDSINIIDELKQHLQELKGARK